MDKNKFIQASATIRVLEKKLLGRAELERLIESDNLDEALRFLSDSPYQTQPGKNGEVANYEKDLQTGERNMYNELYKISPYELPIDLVTLKYVYHNLKVLVKEHILKEDLSDLYVSIGNLDFLKIKQGLETGDKGTSDDYMSVAYNALEIYNSTLDPQQIDIYIDSKYFAHLSKIAKMSEVKLFNDYVENLIDFTNIKIMLRCQKQERESDFFDKVIIDGGSIDKQKLLDYKFKKIDSKCPLFRTVDIGKVVIKALEIYEKTGQLSPFDKVMDNYMLDLVKETKKVTYGPEVVFAYAYAKDAELKNLRTILVSKSNAMDVEFIRERLRDSYV